MINNNDSELSSSIEKEINTSENLLMNIKEDSDLIKAPSNPNTNNESLNINKSCFTKYCGAIEPGSIRASIFSISILTLGAGCLSLPQRFNQMSIFICILEIIITASAAYFCMNALIKASNICGEKSYYSVVDKIIGRKMALTTSIMTIIITTGTSIVYNILSKILILVYRMIGAFVFQVGNFPQKSLKEFYEQPDSLWATTYFKFCMMIGTSLILLLPLNLLKDVTKLRFTSIFGIFCFFVVCIIIIAQLPMYINNYSSDIVINWFDISNAFDKNLYFFKGSATIFYTYGCHAGLFPVVTKIFNPTEDRVKKVLRRNIILNTMFFIIIGTVGYLTQPKNTPSFIMEREKIGNDIVMTIGRLLFSLLMICKIPATYNNIRINIFEICFNTTEITNKRYFLIQKLNDHNSDDYRNCYSWSCLFRYIRNNRFYWWFRKCYTWVNFSLHIVDKMQ